jgi:hypothetical protein
MILMIPDFLWIFDFFSLLIRGSSIVGIADYFFFVKKDIFQIVIATQHFYTVPLGIWALKIMKAKKSYRALLISFIEILFFCILMLIISPGGVNCLPTLTNCTSVVFPN